MPLRHAHMALSASLSHPSLRATGSKTSTRRRATLSPAPRPRALSRGRARCTRWPRRTTRALSSRASTPSKRRDLSILRDSRSRFFQIFSRHIRLSHQSPQRAPRREGSASGAHTARSPRVTCHAESSYPLAYAIFIRVATEKMMMIQHNCRIKLPLKNHARVLKASGSRHVPSQKASHPIVGALTGRCWDRPRRCTSCNAFPPSAPRSP